MEWGGRWCIPGYAIGNWLVPMLSLPVTTSKFAGLGVSADPFGSRTRGASNPCGEAAGRQDDCGRGHRSGYGDDGGRQFQTRRAWSLSESDVIMTSPAPWPARTKPSGTICRKRMSSRPRCRQLRSTPSRQGPLWTIAGFASPVLTALDDPRACPTHFSIHQCAHQDPCRHSPPRNPERHWRLRAGPAWLPVRNPHPPPPER